MAFLHAGCTIVEKHLTGEKLRIDTGCVVAFEPEIEFSIERAGRASTMFLGGEGLFLATLESAGRVRLQSLPFSKVVVEVIRHIRPPSNSGWRPVPDENAKIAASGRRPPGPPPGLQIPVVAVMSADNAGVNNKPPPWSGRVLLCPERYDPLSGLVDVRTGPLVITVIN